MGEVIRPRKFVRRSRATTALVVFGGVAKPPKSEPELLNPWLVFNPYYWTLRFVADAMRED